MDLWHKGNDGIDNVKRVEGIFHLKSSLEPITS